MQVTGLGTFASTVIAPQRSVRYTVAPMPSVRNGFWRWGRCARCREPRIVRSLVGCGSISHYHTRNVKRILAATFVVLLAIAFLRAPAVAGPARVTCDTALIASLQHQDSAYQRQHRTTDPRREAQLYVELAHNYRLCAIARSGELAPLEYRLTAGSTELTAATVYATAGDHPMCRQAESRGLADYRAVAADKSPDSRTADGSGAKHAVEKALPKLTDPRTAIRC